MTDTRWMIYGANGYTGRLIAQLAHRQGLTPLLAGRSETTVAGLAQELNLEYRVFSLDDPAAIAKHLQDVALVLHCAGPFSATSAPMVAACLQSRTHYLDITGEIEVFEHTHDCHDQAQAAGVVLCSGVGFDVVPTDCLAATLKAALPDAQYLALGFDSRSGLSPGTTKTALEGLPQGGRVRRDGRIVPVPLAYKTRRIDFGNGEKNAMTIPWGDVVTAYYSTGIPNIEVYCPTSRRIIAWSRRLNPIRAVFGWSLVQRLLKNRITRRVIGPDEAQRERFPTYVWGEVSNAAGVTKTARIKTANGYDVTCYGALAVVTRLLEQSPAGGSYTPAQLMGADLLTRLPGSGELVIM